LNIRICLLLDVVEPDESGYSLTPLHAFHCQQAPTSNCLEDDRRSPRHLRDGSTIATTADERCA
jgi:hypothetical protein